MEQRRIKKVMKKWALILFTAVFTMSGMQLGAAEAIAAESAEAVAAESAEAVAAESVEAVAAESVEAVALELAEATDEDVVGISAAQDASDDTVIAEATEASESSTESGLCETENVIMDSTEDIVADPGEESTAQSLPEGTITFDGNTAVVQDSISGNVIIETQDGITSVTIKASGNYILTGTGENITVTVKKGTTGVKLTLQDLKIDDSALWEMLADKEAEEAVITVKSGCEAAIRPEGDSVLIGSAGGSEPIVKAKEAKLTFCGSGILTLKDSPDDGIKAKDGTVTIQSGTVNISDCRGDGIQAEEINIEDGTINISTVFEHAASSFYGSDKKAGNDTTLNYIWEEGAQGSTTKYERINLDTGSHKGLKGGTKAETISFASGEESITQDASGGIWISGGTVTIDTTKTGLKANALSTSGYTAAGTGAYIIGSPEDGIHSNNTLSITGGRITVASADDGVTGETVEITGSDTKLDIVTCYEGMEGSMVNIGTKDSTTGPEITINSNDDGINASGKTVTYTYDSRDGYDLDDEINYLKKSVSKSGNACNIYSGNVLIRIDSADVDQNNTTDLPDGSLAALKTVNYSSSGDGIDCNGSLTVYGGKLYVYGQSSGDNSPIDSDNGFTLYKSATVLATGVDGMNEAKPGSTPDNAVYVTYGSSQNGMPGNPGEGTMPGTPGEGTMPGNLGEGTMPGTPGEGTMPGNPGEGTMPGASAYSAGQYFLVTLDGTTIYSTQLPFAGSFILYASPELQASSGSYVTSISSDGTPTEGNPGTPTEGNPGGGNDGSISGNSPKSGMDARPIIEKTAENAYSLNLVKGQRVELGDGTWSLKEGAAYVSWTKKGVVTGRKKGTAVLVNTKDGVESVYHITVYQPSLEKKKLVLYVGESGTLSFGESVGEGMPQAWLTSNPMVASVAQEKKDGSTTAMIQATGTGKAKITACIGGRAYTAAVIVKNVVSPVKLSKEDQITINALQTYRLKYDSSVFLPSKAASWKYGNADGQELGINEKKEWVDAGGLFKISKSGLITALKTGSATIYGTDSKGGSAVLTVTIQSMPVKTELYLNAGQSTTLKHTFVKNNNVTWTGGENLLTLKNTDKAKVRITAGSVTGHTTLTCTYQGITYCTTVHVTDPSFITSAANPESPLAEVKSGNPYYCSVVLKKGETLDITKWQPGMAEQTVNWKSGNAKKVFVNENGIMEAVSSGKTTVSATINGRIAKIMVTVTD
ncbi:MAG: carbohydrate-binding domain-containing protein [Lachnospiraceae bacterium]|nr:carbohydrate-binding domain-containing protein [Lachnospiraceae bacterium]